ncbi:MAG TPA: tetratricopeptide repeat protein [Usitatibacter sp.]|nr:tetratricopeptide repeat protein [Usitatibacter sp.]
MSFSTAESRALGLFQQGRLAEAEAAWRSILERKPDDPEALHLLGLILVRTGRAEGLQLLDRSIERAPRNPAFLNNRAQILAEAGRSDEALRDLRRAVMLEPRFHAAYCHLGSLLRRLGRLDEALAAFRKALAIDPRVPDAHVGVGNVLRERGDPDGARAAYGAALHHAPANASAHYNLGTLMLKTGDTAAAEHAFRRALEFDPRNVFALNNLGTLLREAGRVAEALECFEKAVAIDPRNVEALNNLGVALQEEERYPEAIARYREAVQQRPGFAEALLNWGNTLKDMGDLDGAGAIYAQALAVRPGYIEALINSGSVALDRGSVDDARSWYSQVLELEPQSADAQYGLGQIALREGRFAEGWDGYERRFETDPPQAPPRRLRQPRLTAADLGRARCVALWSEQGIGDQVLFSTLLPELERRGIKGVVEVDARLAPLYRRSLPRFEFVPPESAQEAFAACDYELPMGSLPGLFRRDVASFAAQPRALLSADARRMTAIREQLGRGRVIGISWRSLQKGGRRALGERKSIPLEHFAPLAQATGARLLDLQYGDVTAERDRFAARHPGVLVQIDGLDLHDDLDGVAAAIACCDRVVTSSNVTAHLAGALGKATQVVYLRDWPPFSYWTPGENGQSRWYPSVRVESDPAWTTWEQALEGLAKRLAGE